MGLCAPYSGVEGCAPWCAFAHFLLLHAQGIFDEAPCCLVALLPAGLILAALSTSLLGTAAQADDKITVEWKNHTGTSITVSNPPTCTPSGSCTYPTSISSGTTGQIVQQASSTAFIRQIIFRYRYYDSGAHTDKECQVSVWTTKSGGSCDYISPNFDQTDGTAYSPACDIEDVQQSVGTCDFLIKVKMSN